MVLLEVGDGMEFAEYIVRYVCVAINTMMLQCTEHTGIEIKLSAIL